jgi:hypothetical protein
MSSFNQKYHLLHLYGLRAMQARMRRRDDRSARMREERLLGVTRHKK